MPTLKLNPVCIGKRKCQCRRIPHNMNNQSMHWANKSRWAKAWQEEIGWAFMQERKKFGKLPLSYAHISIVFYNIKMFDQDGAYNAAKPLVDSLKPFLDSKKEKPGLGIIIDDSAKYIDLNVVQFKVKTRKEERVEIDIN